MTYRAPVADFEFICRHVVGFSQVTATDRYAETTDDLTHAILTEAGKLCDDVMAPLQRVGDQHPARLENGVVRTSPGWRDGWAAIAEGGWIGIAGDPEHGGMGLPMTVATAVNDMMSGACLSLQLAPLMSQGQIEALEHHASDALKALYLPKLISGEWAGTMNLTEPQAGSDVGALSSKAEDNGDGSYAISGQKIYISYGEHDLTENICHLVLARLPDAVPGTKGISLFLVPKRLPDADGNAGVANTLKVVSLEHKMGLHGSPTCVMQYDGATGWMVGEPGGGMAAMFTMMNNARLGVGCQGVGVAEGAFQQAMAYALERKQGRSLHGYTIAAHADVRRMLMAMKAEVFAARSIALACAVAIDMETATDDADWRARAALLTPIAKACGTETGNAVAQTGIQVHGGMGFVEDSGAAQFARDVRVTSIYEGTNGIQAMDLVGRKLLDGGETAFRLLDEVEAHSETVRSAQAGLADLAGLVWDASESLRETTEWMVAHSADDRAAGAVPFLKAFARVLGGHYHLRAAQADPAGPRAALARFYIERLLPEHAALLTEAQAGSDGLYAMSLDDLAA
ncbi:MAG: acyl-CoA dehydrogenase [Rhodobacteraceae bacterium]|nr:acyl-CoA dehydrogenase [Paracoccaceae bacterium]